jgi:hypothetical protein
VGDWKIGKEETVKVLGDNFNFHPAAFVRLTAIYICYYLGTVPSIIHTGGTFQLPRSLYSLCSPCACACMKYAI